MTYKNPVGTIFIALFFILLSSCTQQISNKERLQYFAIISLQAKEAETSLDKFNRQLIEIKRTNKPVSVDSIDNLRTKLSILIKEIEDRAQVINKVQRQKLDLGLKKYGSYYLIYMSRFLKTETPLLIKQLDPKHRHELNEQDIQRFTTMRRQLEKQAQLYHFIRNYYVREYSIRPK